MNTELFNKLNDHFNKTLNVGEFGLTEYHAPNSTMADLGTVDDISIPIGTYFYAYSDEAADLPLPMFCLPLVDEMYNEGFCDSHQVLIWKLESTDLPFDDPFAPVPEGTIELPCEEVCPGEAEVLSGNNYH